MSRVARALARATARIGATSDTARLDAELLMAAALGIGRDRLILDPPNVVAPDQFAEMVDRRCAGEPVAYITGHRAFWTIDLEVGPGALIPRPDSETLLVAAVEHFAGTPGPKRILDLGTGPGTLLLAALDEWPEATGIGVDASPIALSFAQRNAERLGLGGRAALQLGDWGKGLRSRFDLILCNPPYVNTRSMARLPAEYQAEPALALAGGTDGMDFIRQLLADAPAHMSEHAVLVLEIGNERAHFEAAFPRLPAVWLETSAGDDQVLLLTREALLSL